MGFSVPLNFHKDESICHILQFKAKIQDDGVRLAMVILKPASRELLFEKGEFLTECNMSADFSALVGALLVCLENDIKTIFIEGECDEIRRDNEEFVNNLFGQFEYVYFKGELKDASIVDSILDKVGSTRSLYFVRY